MRDVAGEIPKGGDHGAMLRSRSTVAVAVAFLGAYLGAGCGSSGTLADAGVADAQSGRRRHRLACGSELPGPMRAWDLSQQ
jgi:hypothetical protein